MERQTPQLARLFARAVLSIVLNMLSRLFQTLMMALTVLTVSAQMACAADDLTLGALEGHSVHHADAEHDHHESDAPCQDACVTHHLVLLPGLVEPAVLSLSGLERVERQHAFTNRALAPPYAPPRSVTV